VTATQAAPETSASRRRRMRAWMVRAYPVLRSITGDGVRRTLDLIEEALPAGVLLQRDSVPSGTDVFDWTVPEEWNVREAWIADASGRHVVDVRDHTLHLVGYSAPFRGRLPLEQLHGHLHSLPDLPDLIPYRTSYYHRDWGFCLADRQRQALLPGEYEVVVNTELAPGELVLGEVVLPGREPEEVLVSAHVCHPSLVNDNLTGIAAALELLALLAARQDRRYTYRFVFAPGTIGSLAWLWRNPDARERVAHGLVLTGLGGGGPLVYKQTRRGTATVDAAAAHVVGRRGGEVRRYSPYGYDERQYNAVGFELPVGRLTRTPHGEYPEYHTSGDDLDFVTDDELEEAVRAVAEIVAVLEGDRRYLNLSPYGEPQLGKRGLYPTMGGQRATDAVMAMLWTLAYADGDFSLLDVAELADLPFSVVRGAADDLMAAGLLAEVADATRRA
jgi:aminopeptidase-like protein